jgi:concanavalin A-like lectin/glucanase superfamily protein
MRVSWSASARGVSGVVVLLALAGSPAPAIEVAEDLIVDLDARDLDEGAGPDQWVSAGSLGDFQKVGEPVVETIAGARAVTFNGAGTGDSYQSLELVPPGLVGPDPTRTIEAWVYNPSIGPEEPIVAWGHRGGPDGSNMSFNYGTDDRYGGVGHWNLNFQDIGWTKAPIAGQWHHLVYTYDGTTTRIYADGALDNSEVLGAGAINTHSGMPIALAEQYIDDGVNFEGALPGQLSIGKLRIHDGVLTDAQVLANYNEERPRFPFDNQAPSFLDAPADDTVLKGLDYHRSLLITGYPVPALEITPAGATSTVEVAETNGQITAHLLYALPASPPPSFMVKVKGSNSAGSSEVSWTVTVKDPTGSIEVAEDLVVDLDARDLDEGPAPDTWLNHGSMGDFQLVAGSQPTVTTLHGARAVSFNACLSNDAYQSLNPAADGIVGLDPTVTVEAWVLNPNLADEEAIVEWGKRGGPDGTEMSFSYSLNAEFGAVGHWGPGPNMGWGTVPAAGRWHHLVYTYDGSTQRVYSDGLETNSEALGNGVIDTFSPAPVFIAVQTEPDGITPSWPFRGSMFIARLRIHDGVLDPSQIQNNYLAEKAGFGEPPPPSDPVGEKIPLEPLHRYTFDDGPEDVLGAAHAIAYGNVTFENGQAVLHNLGTENSNMNGLSPPAAPPGAYIEVPNGTISGLGNQATIEAWVTWNGPAGAVWQRIFDFGTSDGGENNSTGANNTNYLFVTPRSGQNTFHYGYRNGTAPVIARFIETTPILTMNEEKHIVVVWDGGTCTTSFYLDGEKIGENSIHFDLTGMVDVNNWLGRSQWPDAMLNGSFSELRLYDYALTQNQVLGNFDAGPDVVNTPPPRAEVVRSFSQPTFDLGQPFVVSLAVTLHAPDTAVDIAEVFPAGASVSEVSDGGVLSGDRILWSLTGITSKTVTYKVTPPAGCAGVLQFGNSTWKVSGTPGHVTGPKKIAMTMGGGNLGSWLSADIGDPEGGALRLADREVLVRGGGKGLITTTTDGFHYLYVPTTGDFELSAKVDCADDPGGGGLAGLMVRESLDPSSAHLIFSLSSVAPVGGGLGTLRCDFRRETLATRTSQILLAFQPKDVNETSVYLKIRRASNPTTQARTLYFERSADGIAWTPLSSKVIGTTASQINLKEDALIGLAVTGGGKGNAQYTFREVHGAPEVPPFPGGTVSPQFRRGDVDGTGVVELTDVINLIGFLFLGSPANLDCFDAADVDDTGVVELTDAIVEIGWLFLGNPKDLPAPGPLACGADPTADDLAPCGRACQ